MADYRLPSLGADMDTATFVAWRIKPGDRVRRGDVVGAVETSKGIIDIEIFDSGVVDELIAAPGAHLAVGDVIARIRSDAPGTTAPAVPAPAVPIAPAVPAATPAELPPVAPADVRIRISPAARQRAEALTVPLDGLRGSGPGGAVTLEDVERAAQARSAAPADMRATIAAAMTRAKREIPHYYLATAIDLQPALDWLAERNRQRPITERLLPAVLFIRAVARALTAFPDFNGHYREQRFVAAGGIHVGVAVTLRDGGLVAPALHDAAQGSLDELMRAFQDLVTRARSGHLRASEMADAGITVTSLGERGVDLVFPVIYPPQVAIVGFGRVKNQAVALADGSIAAHPVVQATLAADHRLSNGHRGGLFLAAVESALQSPEQL